MCDKGHIIVELLHQSVPPKICSIQAGSIEIDFRTEEIHIYHCPCHTDCSNVKTCNKCDRNMFLPQDRVVSHQCRDAVATIRIISKECFQSMSKVPKSDVKVQTCIVTKQENCGVQCRINEECPLPRISMEEKKSKCQWQQTDMKVAKNRSTSISRVACGTDRKLEEHKPDPYRWQCRKVEGLGRGQRIEDLKEPATYKVDPCGTKAQHTPTQSRLDNACKDVFLRDEPDRFIKCDQSLPTCVSENVVEECCKKLNCREILNEIVDCEIEKSRNGYDDSCDE